MSGAHKAMDAQVLRASYEADGYVSIPGFLSARELRNLRAELDRVIREVVPQMPAEEVYFEDVEDPSSLKQLQRLHAHDRALASSIEIGPMARVAAILLGDVPLPQNLQYFDKAPGLNRPTPAHQDGAYFSIAPMNAVTLWLALEDVGTTQGCIHYVAGSHLQGLRPHRRSDTLGFSRELACSEPADAAHEVAFPCAAGHLIAHHALTVHRADGNQSPNLHRRALGYIYYGGECVVDEVARSAYRAQLDDELRASGLLDTP